MNYTAISIRSNPEAAVVVYSHDDHPVAYAVEFNGREHRYPNREQAIAVWDWLVDGME